MRRQLVWRSVAALGFGLAIAGTAWANGEGFFAPAPTDQPIDLVYVGHVRDRTTGRLIQSPAFVTITDNYSGLSFPFTNDTPGHFRSPDIGLALKEDFGPVKSETLEMRVVVAGYESVTIKKVPRKAKGIVELNVKLEPQDGVSPAAPLESSSGIPPMSPTGKMPWPELAGGLSVIIVGIAARTLGPRRSTTH